MCFNKTLIRALAFAGLLVCIISCSTGLRLFRVQKNAENASVTLPAYTLDTTAISIDMSAFRDTLRIVDAHGDTVILMRAISDEATGEMSATEFLDASVVTTRFRNVAERHGKVVFTFDILVPKGMLSPGWQVRVTPLLYVNGSDTARSLANIDITGNRFDEERMRGRERYERLLNSIVSDPTLLIDTRQLEIYFMRHIPELYDMKFSDEFISVAQFESVWGVSEAEAVAHYVAKYRVKQNNNRIARKESSYAKWIVPYTDSAEVRLDTIVTRKNGDFIYTYTETLDAMEGLQKADLELTGGIYAGSGKLYDFPAGESVTFYVSSLASLADTLPKYFIGIVDRKLRVDTSFALRFEGGSDRFREKYAGNASAVKDIRSAIHGYISDPALVLDSVVVTAWASPEGRSSYNQKISARRAESVREFFEGEADGYGNLLSSNERRARGASPVRFCSRGGGENWKALDSLVAADPGLTERQKEDYFRRTAEAKGDDEREAAIMGRPYYGYIRSNLYPEVRRVDFGFRLHAPGAVKDTVVTDIIDLTYMEGLRLLLEHDYQRAIAILRPYRDYNTALTYLAMDYNMSAFEILSDLPRTARTEYLLSIIYARQNQPANAASCYLRAVSREPALRFRANLDPEIRAIVTEYGLNHE